MDTRQTILLTVVVLLVMVVTSFGFQQLSENPLRPDATLNASDVPGENASLRSDTVEWLRIEHRGGESIDLSVVEIVLLSGDQAVRLSESNGWQTRKQGFVYRLQSSNRSIARNHTFASGDRLTVTFAAVSGRSGADDTYRVRVRMRHIPSQSMIYDERIPIH